MKTKNCRTCWGNLVICLKKSNVFKSTFKKISKPGKFCYWFLLIPCMYFYENMKAFFLIWLCVWRLHYGLLFSIVTLVAVFLYSLWIFLNVWRSLRFFFFKDQQGEKQNDFSNTKLRRTVDAKASQVFCVAIRNILCAFDACTFFFSPKHFLLNNILKVPEQNHDMWKLVLKSEMVSYVLFLIHLQHKKNYITFVALVNITDYPVSLSIFLS